MSTTFFKKLEIKVSRNYYVMGYFVGTKSREKTKRERKNLVNKSEEKNRHGEKEREKKDSNQTGQKRFIIRHKIISGCSYFRVTKTKLLSRKSIQPSHRPTLFHLLIHHAVFTSHLSLIFRLQLTTENHLYSQGNF